MSGSSNGTEWVEATEEVVETEECLPTESNTVAEVQVMEEEKTPIQKLLDTVGQGDNAESDEGFCCEECLSLFQDQSDPENVGGPSFVLDFPTSMGVPQRALLTLPYGLTVGRSSIPNAGVGVINHGPAVSPGMHFGPYEGEVTSRESASGFFWEIRKDKDQYEYIDVARDSHSNWMRYVTCARSRDETNLLAVQYKGSILYHCCRTIHTGEELMVWPSSKLLRLCSEAWRQMWLLKSNTTDADSSLSSTSEVFQCSRCQLPFTTEVFLQCHSEMCHTQAGKSPATAAADPGGDGAAASLAVLSVDSAVSKTCGDCGKVFKQMPHLRRHKLCVHSNKRPFCCPLCRRSFSQASGLIRHHLVHRKQAALDAADPKQNGEEPSAVATPADAAVSEETDARGDASEAVQSPAGEAETPPPNCSDCGTGFASEVSQKKPKATAHERLRPYVCTVCQKSFGQYHDLSRHLRSHQRQKKKWRDAKEDSEDPAAAAAALPFSCAECSLTFSSVDALQQHVDERHSQEQPSEEVTEAVRHAAPQRPQRLGARSKLSAITKLIAPKRRAASPAPSEAEPPANGKSKKSRWFSCNRCKLTYGDPEDLRAHKCARLHNCGECAATFSKRGFLRRHEQSVHARKPFSCDRCEKVFTSSGNLKQHRKSNTCMKYHCTSELFPCSFCQFSFTLKSYLLKHIKRHHPMEYLSHCDSQSLANQLEEEEEEVEGEEEGEGDAAGGAGGEKQHVCPHCSRRCANATALKTHGCFRQVKIMYLCTDCGKGFTNHYSLKQHHRIHTGEKPYSCPHCSKSFAYVGQRNVHLRTHTGEKPYLCTHCGESFRQSGDLKRHERKHTGVRPHRCAECNKSFSRLQSLKAHQMLHRGQRIFKCSQCGKSFSRNYHLRRHHQKMHT